MTNNENCLWFAIKILIICLVFCVIIWILCIGADFFVQERKDTVVFEIKESVSVIIDAGHGGRDGGAVSRTGVSEKDLNLSVSNTLGDVLKLCGMNVVMTRKNDSLVCDENDPALKGRIKMTDLKNRLNIAQDNHDAIFISIHMNNFSVEKYSGLQVYYSPNNEYSFDLAKSIQERVTEVLQNENTRKVKKAGSSIYLLYRITSPAVLIECGFLSNLEEAERLSNIDYQMQLSLVFADCVLKNSYHIGNN